MMRMIAAITVLSLFSSPVFGEGPRTSLHVSATSINAGASITLTATVTGASGAAVPTGTVNFELGASLLATEALNASGQAALTTTSLPVGSDAVTAIYSGDANYQGSSSTPLTITVVTPQPSFAITSNPQTLTVTDGSSVTSTLTVSPADGFDGAVSFACSGLPPKASCSFSPATLTINGAAATTSMTIETAAATTGIALNRMPSRPASRVKPEIAVCGLCAGLLCLGGMRRNRGLACLVVLFGLLVTLPGCASGNVHKVTIPGTPSGTYSVTVTASSGSGSSAVSHATTIALTVN
jgi:hypothetical protein